MQHPINTTLLENFQLIVKRSFHGKHGAREREKQNGVSCWSVRARTRLRTDFEVSRNMYKVIHFEWVTRDLQILYRDIEFPDIKSSDCIATVAEHDNFYMFRDFVSKCVLGLRVTSRRQRNTQAYMYVPSPPPLPIFGDD